MDQSDDARGIHCNEMSGPKLARVGWQAFRILTKVARYIPLPPP